MFRAIILCVILAVAVAFAPSAKWARQSSLEARLIAQPKGAKPAASAPAPAASSKKLVAAAGKAAPAAKAAVSAKSRGSSNISPLNAPVINKKFGKDMTFGGRPNPTPEMLIVEDGAVDKTKLAWTLGWKN